MNFPCDTLLLSVGLKPLTEHLSGLDLLINPRTKGPMVDSNYMSSVEGIFFCGNNLHVHDIADEVSVEARLAVKGILSWLEEPEREEIDLKEGQGISLVIPNSINPRKDSSIYYRVSQFSRGKSIVLRDEEGAILYHKKLSVARPSQGERIDLAPMETSSHGLTLEVID